jgi:hypothetical protein
MKIFENWNKSTLIVALCIPTCIYTIYICTLYTRMHINRHVHYTMYLQVSNLLKAVEK